MGLEPAAPMLKLGKLTDYATVLLATMATAPDRLHSGQELAQRTAHCLRWKAALPTTNPPTNFWFSAPWTPAGTEH